MRKSIYVKLLLFGTLTAFVNPMWCADISIQGGSGRICEIQDVTGEVIAQINCKT